jgi:hypothetical protein
LHGREVKLQEGEADAYEWVTLEEAKNYDLLDGIYEELEMTEKKEKGRKRMGEIGCFDKAPQGGLFLAY